MHIQWHTHFPMKRLALVSLLLGGPLAAFAATYSFSTTSINDLAHGQAATWNLGSPTPGATGSYDNLLAEFNGTTKKVLSAKLTLYDPRDWKDEPKDVLYVNILKGLDKSSPYVDKVTYNSNPSQTDTTWGPNAFDDSSGWRNNNAHNAGLKFTDAQTGSLLKAPDTAADNLPNDLPGTWTDIAGPYGSGANVNYISDVAIQFSAQNLYILNEYLKDDKAENADSTGNSWGIGLGFAAECHYYFSNIKLEITVGDAPPPPPPSVPDSASTLVLLSAAIAGVFGLRRRLVRA
jgi:hypothetical protein